MKRILFVDDEPNILEGLQRMLRSMRKEWDMAFAKSGQEALDLMASKPFDIVVSDMRMPGMDGAALLTEVMKRYPETVRFVLSGQYDKETVFQSVGHAHQFLAKPCDAETLKASVARAFALRDLLSNNVIKRLVLRIGGLPAMPASYNKLMTELRLPDACIAVVGKIIGSDVGMTAKVLQLANSAFFGVRQPVTNATQAVTLLGLDIIKSLVLVTGAFTQAFQKKMPPAFSLDRLWHHSVKVGAYSQAISKAEKVSDRAVNDGLTAGLLHDLGVLVFAGSCPGDYNQVLNEVSSSGVLLAEAEQGTFGCTHAEVGAYLLGIWGLPDSVVEAVAFHHRPSDSLTKGFGPLTAAHVGNVIEYKTREGDASVAVPRFDFEHLDELGLRDRIARWQEICFSIDQEMENRQ